MNRPVISITTDFGGSDYDAGVLAGVIWSIAPQAGIAVLTHDVTPFNVLEGAVILSRCVPYFPDGTVHLAVVDPGVGTPRRGLAAHIGGQYFVGPDNGLCSLLVEQARKDNLPVEFHALENPLYWLPAVTRIFHGRDVFAPVAAHLASGVPLAEFGPALADPVLIHLPIAQKGLYGWRGTILHIDHFGNLTSNLTSEHLAGRTRFQITIQGEKITDLAGTYGAAQAGELITLLDDSDCLEIAVSRGSAEKRLQAVVGTEFELVFQE
ncbi:MAG: SAM-dependent chlorinase/fluorinase [Leptolinea sp.]|jgi:S-adenosylmethionine hydrolase|nr:SAM-dependent chlorinase/fluorinase [Leptolinea sp.]